MWATEPHAELPVKMGTEGVSAKAATTVFNVFRKAVEDHGERPAICFKDASQVQKHAMPCGLYGVYCCRHVRRLY